VPWRLGMTQGATSALRLPWGTTADGEFTRDGTIVASVMGTFAVLVTFPLGVLGVVLSCLGLDRIRRQEPSGRTLMIVSWILFVPGTVIGVPLAIALLVSLVSCLFG
jgi:hypothetical protein